jgi:hypothetical protein
MIWKDETLLDGERVLGAAFDDSFGLGHSPRWCGAVRNHDPNAQGMWVQVRFFDTELEARQHVEEAQRS